MEKNFTGRVSGPGIEPSRTSNLVTQDRLQKFNPQDDIEWVLNRKQTLHFPETLVPDSPRISW